MTPPRRRTHCEHLPPLRHPGRRATRLAHAARRARRLTAGAVVCAGLVVGGLALTTIAEALPANVILLRGSTSQDYDAAFTYAVKRATINGFAISYTCHGKEPATDSDIWGIADDGDDSKALAKRGAGGTVSLSLNANVSRQSEDGPLPKGRGRLVVKAKLTTIGRKRILKGTARVQFAKCPSAPLTFRAVGTAK